MWTTEKPIIIMCTDLNIEKEKIKEFQLKYPSAEIFSNMNYERFDSTVKPTHGNSTQRQIDYIFSSERIKESKQITRPGECGADHSFITSTIEI